MHAVDERQLLLEDVRGDRLVGKDHGLFDHGGRIGLHAQVDADGMPHLVEHGLCLDRVEVEAAARVPERGELDRQLVELEKLALVGIVLPALEDILDLVVVVAP